jgi:predicted ATPase
MESLDAQPVLDQLRGLIDASTTTDQNRTTARQWFDDIAATRDFLYRRDHSIVFLGAVGVGKSSLIGVLAGLILGEITDRPSLKDNSILSIGSGRTTVCEVRIVASPPERASELGLRIEPFESEEMEKEIEDYARREWERRHPAAGHEPYDDALETAQEIHRFIRTMTGYAERQEVVLENGLQRRRNIRPLDDVIPRFGKPEELAAHLVERANLPLRTEKDWWWSAGEEGRRELKRRFEAINRGSEPTAMLPRRMTVVVPEPLLGSTLELDLTLIDTRGLDGGVESRRDLQDLLQEPRAVTILCAPFKEAPGETVRALLRAMGGDARLRPALEHALMVLVDQGDADQVNGANGIREFGQDIKIDECHRALDWGLSPTLGRDQLVAFDAIKDERGRLLAAVEGRLAQLRLRREDLLREQIEDAQRFFGAIGDQVHLALREQVDQQVRAVVAPYILTNAPLEDALAGLYDAIDECRYASVVYATCRRQGRYASLDAYAAVEARASQGATAWLDPPIVAAKGKLNELLEVAKFQVVGDHVRRLGRDLRDGQLAVVKDYAQRVGDQVKALLAEDEVWARCVEEWGRGSGFKSRVLDLLRAWSSRQHELTEHQRTSTSEHLPLLQGLVASPTPLTFTLWARNLRALHRASWTPAPVSILIGANGAGKSTLLQTLRLLRLAYERGLPEAVALVLRGSNNLKSWGADADETVEIGLDLGTSSWRIELIAREGTVDYLTNERFTDEGRELFSRDALGAFVHGDKRLDAVPQTGLRALMDRGAQEPALRRMAAFLQSIAVYHDPDLWTLREQGSSTSQDRHLNPRGTNALTLLRRWHQERTHRDRYAFVVDGLEAAFPSIVGDLDFVEAGNTLVARVFRPGVDEPTPLADEANGVLQLLVLLCEVAGAPDQSIVAIDEPENSLHPYALRVFLRRASRWAQLHDLTVLLVTHSVVLLDELDAHPDQVYVMKPREAGEPVPTRLDELCDPRWLAGFRLGELYEQGEIGSNED